MYLRHLRIENVKLFKEFELPFLRDGKARMWTVFVGENGIGKTTILQAIAAAASGKDRANQLADVPSWRDVRSPDRAARVTAKFEFGKHGDYRRTYPFIRRRRVPPQLESELVIGPRKNVFEGKSRYKGLRTPKADPLAE